MFYNNEAEQATLGSCLLNKEALLTTIENLEVGDFYNIANVCIYKNMLELFHDNVSVDVVSLTDKLDHMLSHVGGVSYLMRLMDSVPNIQNIETYNQIVKKKSQQRKIWKILNNVKDGKIELDEAQNKIEDIPNIKVNEATFKDTLHNTLDNSLLGTAYKYKMEELNRYLGGIDKGELCSIGGWTSQGKSSMAIQLAIDFATQHKRVLYLTSEMTPIEACRRILANLEEKSVTDLRKGLISEEERSSLDTTAKYISENWDFNVKKVMSVDDMRKYVRKYTPEIIFIDYLQNLASNFDYISISKDIKDIQNLTLNEELATFCVSQFNRNKDERVREPRLTDLRGSGRIEECSNQVIFLYWRDRLLQQNEERFGGEEPEELLTIFAKNRDGSIGKKMLNFYPEYCKVQSPKPKGGDLYND
jgi:replicative DNA helicase